MIRFFIIAMIVLTVACVGAPADVFAQGTPPSGEAVGVFDNPLEAKSLTELLMSVLRAIVRVVGVLLVLAFVFIGFQFVMAQGNVEALSKARQNLMWTAIGAAILLGAEGIALVIEATARSLAP